MLEILEKFPHENILEVGCGLNPVFTSISQFESMTIVEPAPDFFRAAKERAKKDERNIFCIQGFLEEKILEIKNLGIKYDYIITSGLLHEVENPQKLLKSLYMLCERDTVLHINVPNALSFHRIIGYEMGVIDNIYQCSEQQAKFQQKQLVYDLNSIKRVVTENGFEVIEEGTYLPKFLTHKQLKVCMDEGIIDERILEGIYNLERYVPQYGSELYVQLRPRGYK